MSLRAALIRLTRGVAGGRVHWLRVPQGLPTPYVVLNEISGVGHYHTQGRTRHRQTRVQCDIYAATLAEAEHEMAHLTAALSGARDGEILAVFVGEPADATTWDGGQVDPVVRFTVDLTIHSNR